MGLDFNEEVERVIDNKNEESLSESSLRHELIGKPCLYPCDGKLYPAIPYISYKLSEGDESNVRGLRKRGQLLTILYFAENEPVEGIAVKVKAISGILPEKLIPLDSSSKQRQEIYHTILTWLANNRAGTFEHPTK